MRKIAVLLKFFKGELNPFDGAALECALEWGGEIWAVAMAPSSALPALEGLTRLGVRAVLISDSAYAGSDTQATSYVLSEALYRIAPDVIFTGRQSVDGDTGQVPPMIAERMGLSLVPSVMEFEDGRAVCRDGREYTCDKGVILSFERIRTLRFPSIFSKKGSVELWDNSRLGLDLSKCGLSGSPTRVVRSYESTVGRRECIFTSIDKLDSLISDALAKERSEDASYTGEKLPCIHYFGEIESIAAKYADKTVRLSADGKSPRELGEEITSLGASVVLFEDTAEYKLLAPRIAVHTGAGICADCISFRVEGGRIVMTRPALGGNVTADIVCTSDIAFATVRTVKRGGSDVVFALGRGAIPFMDDIRALAEKYGAELVSSRVLADNGKMPYSSQVGLTGRVISPKVYVAFGISGAVQHTCAIASSGTVIAINSDKNARIFDYADYGIADGIEKLF